MENTALSTPYECVASTADLHEIGIINAVYTGYGGGLELGSSSSIAAHNQAALQQIVYAAMQNGGGTILIPCGTYHIAGAVSVDNTYGDYGVVIKGTSGGTELVQDTAGSALFLVSNLTSGLGIRFEDLHINYKHNSATGAAIQVSNCRNVSCERLYFANCPTSFSDDAESAWCGLYNCTVDYDGAAGATMLTFGGTSDYILDCIIRQTALGHDPPGPANCTGVLVTTGANILIANSHISDFNIGINVTAASSPGIFVSNVICESWQTSLQLIPAVGKQIHSVLCDSDTFAISQNSTATAAGIIVDTGGGENSSVSDILFQNCMCYGWNGSGLEINAGENIEVNGGRFGSCSLSSGSSGGGIAITGAAANVTIEGVDCTGKVPTWPKQPYGISISAPAIGLYIADCNLTNNQLGATYLNDVGTDLQIVNCAGYNDLGTVVASSAPSSGTPFSGTSLGYFGPVVFYANSTLIGTINGITISGKSTLLKSGCFPLGAGPTNSAVITYTGSAPSFLMIGQ